MQSIFFQLETLSHASNLSEAWRTVPTIKDIKEQYEQLLSSIKEQAEDSDPDISETEIILNIVNAPFEHLHIVDLQTSDIEQTDSGFTKFTLINLYIKIDKTLLDFDNLKYNGTLN